MINELEYVLRPTPLYPYVRPLLHAVALRVWHRSRRPPVPQLIKQEMVRSAARRNGIRVLVETGTFYGDMIEAVRRDFTKVYSIELSEKLHDRARRRFHDAPNVLLRRGDSATELPTVLREVTEPALFWLDGHYSGMGTARGAEDTPIRAELEAVLTHAVRGHVVMIDDARLFGRGDGYPSIDAVRAIVAKHRPDLQVRVEDDVIYIEPAAAREPA